MGDTEALLLVDDEQAQVLEGDVLLQQLVGADDQIHVAGGQIFLGLLLHFRRPEPAENVDIYGEAPEPGHGGLIVLLSKHRGGHQNRRLLSVHDGLHNRPEGHLGFAEAHVAAEQPVHGGGGLHIPLDVGDAAQLVVGLGVGEVVLKFPLPGGVGGEGVARLPLPGGVKLDELPGHILGGLPGPGLGFLPGVGADLVELDIAVLAAASDVFAHQVQLGGGDEKGVAALIGNLNVVLDAAVHLDLLHGHKPADAVVFVDHQVSRGQVRKGVELLPVGGGGLLGGPLFRLGPGHKLALGEDGQLGQRILHAEGQGPVGEENLSGAGHGGQGDAEKGRQSPLPEHLLQQLRPVAGAAEHQRAELHFLIVLQI